MTNRIDVTVFCSRKSKQRFLSTFEEQQPGAWRCIKNLPLEPTPLMERIKSALGGKGNGAAGSNSLNRITGDLFYDLPCPFCENACLVHCGSCGSLSCHPTASGEFHCPVCKRRGVINSELRDLSGKTSKYQGRRKQ